MPDPLRLRLLTLICGLVLAACGGGGGGADAMAGTSAVSVSVSQADALATATPTADPGAPAYATSTHTESGGAAPLQAPTLPRSSLVAADLAVLYARGDTTSEAIARAYQQARGIPEANLIGVDLPAALGDAISAADFASVKADIDNRLPAHVQATLLTWTQPSRVQGSCSMGITSALAWGYSAARCGGCSRTQASAYYDSDSSQPFTELQMRPSMMLGASTLEAAQALIARGLAADGSQPTGTGYLLRTSDAARSVRYADFAALPADWAGTPGLALDYIDASAGGGTPQALSGKNDVLFYFTGLARVPQLASNRFLPGAAADHLTSFAGLLPGANGQMPVTDWLAAGATASYGTVEEPCNFVDKFPKASVLIEHYLRGATLIEAYWKSVAWPGQGLFVGEPLARPWADSPTATIEGSELVVRSRALRRHASYRVDWLAAGSSQWQTLAALTAGQPRPITWRVPLPADAHGGRLRWIGPCPTAPASSCVLAES